VATLLGAVAVSARHRNEMNGWRTMGHLPGRDWEHVRGMGNATFEQYIDHSNPDLGTFEQFYYYDTTYWKGPGECRQVCHACKIPATDNSMQARQSSSSPPAKLMRPATPAISAPIAPLESSPRRLEPPQSSWSTATGALPHHSQT